MKATNPDSTHLYNLETAVFTPPHQSTSSLLWTESSNALQSILHSPADLEMQARQHLQVGNVDAAAALFEALWELYLSVGNLTKMQETMQKIIIIAPPEIAERYGRIRAVLKTK